MNLVVDAPTWLVVFLIAALVAAAAEDAWRLKISNITCLAVFAGAIVAAALHGLDPSMWQNLALFVGILGIGTFVFSAGWLGGGDVKLLAALGLWFDLQAAAGMLAAVFLAGGLLAIVFISVRRLVFAGDPARRRSRQMPYGLAIVAGALFVIGTQLSQKPTDSFLDRVRASESAAR